MKQVSLDLRALQSIVQKKSTRVNMAPPHSEHFVPKRPRFFQIIHDNAEGGSQDGKLRIPVRFMRNYGHDMSKYIQVKDPSGREWKLECSTCNGVAWFINGWQEFVDFYGIKFGHLLVFEYEEKSKLSVFIFDKTATEIMYSVNGTHDYGCNLDEEFEKTNEEEFVFNELVFETSDDDSSVSSKKRKVIQSPRVDEMKRHSSKTTTKKLSCLANENSGVANIEKTRQLVRDSTTPYERAKAFESENPFAIVIVRPSIIHPKRSQVYLPVLFSNDHFSKSQEGKAILYSGRRRWDVEFRMLKYNTTSSRLTIRTGWKKFYSDNQLKVDDVCVWELINKVDVVFKVHIYRIDEKTGTSAFRRTC